MPLTEGLTLPVICLWTQIAIFDILRLFSLCRTFALSKAVHDHHGHGELERSCEHPRRLARLQIYVEKPCSVGDWT